MSRELNIKNKKGKLKVGNKTSDIRLQTITFKRGEIYQLDTLIIHDIWNNICDEGNGLFCQPEGKISCVLSSGEKIDDILYYSQENNLTEEMIQAIERYEDEHSCCGDDVLIIKDFTINVISDITFDYIK